MANAVTAGHAYVIIGAKRDNSSFAKVLGSIRSTMSGIGNVLMGVGGGLAGLGASIIGPMKAMAFHAMEFEVNLLHLSKRVGTTVTFMSELSYAASLVGVSTETVAGSITKMSAAMFEAAKGSKATGALIKALGLDTKELLGMNPDEQFLALAEAISKVQDQTLKVAAARKFFGRGGAQLLPLLSQGKEGLKGTMGDARRLGVSVSKEDATVAEKAEQMYIRLKASLQGFANTIARAVLPGMTRKIQLMTNLVARLREYLSANPQVVESVYKFGKSLVLAGTALVALGSVIKVLSVAVSPGGVLAGLGIAILAITGALDGVIGKWGEVVLAFEIGGRSIREWGALIAQAWAATAPLWSAIGDMILAAFDYVWAAIKDGFWAVMKAIHLLIVTGFWGAVRGIVEAFVWVAQQIQKVMWGAVKGIWDGIMWVLEKITTAKYELHLIDDTELKDQLDSIAGMKATIDNAANGNASNAVAVLEEVNTAVGKFTEGQKQKVRDLYGDAGTAERERAGKRMGEAAQRAKEAAGAAGDAIKETLGGPLSDAIDNVIGDKEGGPVRKLQDILKGLGQDFADVEGGGETPKPGAAASFMQTAKRDLETVGTFSARSAGSLSSPLGRVQQKQLTELQQIRKMLKEGMAEGAAVVYEE